MSYTVSIQTIGRVSGLSSATACVLAHDAVLAKIGPFDHLVGSGTFQIYRPGYTTSFSSVVLVTETLASAAIGSPVIIDDGTGKWRLGNIVSLAHRQPSPIAPLAIVLAELRVERVTVLGICESDDQHLLALARVAGARTLCTEDKPLMSDFKNASIIAAPRGRIYRDESHVSLLQHDRGCQGHTASKKRSRVRRGRR